MKRMERTAPGRRSAAPARAMTLIELIAVMALLAVVMTISAPVLSRFFRGRSLQEEARRILALTRYARSEAISRSVPMELWINTAARTYGLRAQAGFDFGETGKPVEFNMQEGLTLEVVPVSSGNKGDVRILFHPDGLIDDESLDTIRIVNAAQQEDAVELGKSDQLNGYVIKDNAEKR